MTKQKNKDWVEFTNPKTGNKVGYITEKGDKKVYISERDEDHYFRKYDGFGMSEAVLKSLKEQGIKDICIYYKPLNEVFKTTVEDFSNCEVYENIEGDNQKVMSMEKFEKLLGKKLFEKIVETLKRFISVKDEEYHLLALWVLHTYLVEYFEVTPYVQLTGPAGSGKSTIMRICSKLVRDGKTGSFSEASIYRMFKEDMPTLFFNEFEDIKDKKYLIEVLNNGYEAGQVMHLVIDNEMREFSPFCAKMFGTVNKQSVATLNSRSIEIKTFRATKKIEPLLGKNTEREDGLINLQREIRDYVGLHKEVILELFKIMDIPLMNRAEQIIKPLATIEKYLSVNELVVSIYKKLMKNNSLMDLKTNQALVVLKILYKYGGRIKLKEVTDLFNKEMNKNKPANYIGGILDRVGLKDYKDKISGGYTSIDVPVEVILEHFKSYNMDKELLDTVIKSESNGGSEAPQPAWGEESEGSEANEGSEEKTSYLFNIMEGVI